MRSALATLVVALSVSAHAAAPADKTINILDKKKGVPDLSDVQVDTAPGAVTASTLLGVSGDALTSVQNPRDLTVLLQGLDADKSFGLAISPFRTVLTPIAVADYVRKGAIATRLRSALTIGYAQATTTVDAADYRQRAWSIETSAFLVDDDDPLLAYTHRLGALNGLAPDDDPCVVLPKAAPAEAAPVAEGPPAPAAPGMPVATAASAAPAAPAAVQPAGPSRPVPVDEGLAHDMDRRAAACHALVDSAARWNTSRLWLSLASGEFRGTAAGAPAHSLGRTIVAGVSWGFGQRTVSGDASQGDAQSDLGGQLTLGLRRSLHEPVLATYGDASPQVRSRTLMTLRAAYGKNKLRALVEASNAHDEAPGASGRAYKRALGLDVRLHDGMWLNFRVGRQRRIDNAGDETGSSVVLNISPSALIALGGQ